MSPATLCPRSCDKPRNTSTTPCAKPAAQCPIPSPPAIVVDREASNILAQIPGLAQRYPAKYDVFGDAVQRYNYGNNSLLNVFFNPAMISQV